MHIDSIVLYDTQMPKKVRSLEIEIVYCSVDLLQASVCPNTIWFFVSWHLDNQIVKGQM